MLRVGACMLEVESGRSGVAGGDGWRRTLLVNGRGGNTTVRGRAGQARGVWWGLGLGIAAGGGHVPTMTSFLLISPDIVDVVVVE